MIIIIVIISLLFEFFTPAFVNGLLLKFKRLQASLSLQDSS